MISSRCGSDSIRGVSGARQSVFEILALTTIAGGLVLLLLCVVISSEMTGAAAEGGSEWRRTVPRRALGMCDPPTAFPGHLLLQNEN